MRAPMRGTEMGARMPAIRTTIRGNRKRAVQETGFSALKGMRIMRSFFVVSSLTMGGWIMGTRDM